MNSAKLADVAQRQILVDDILPLTFPSVAPSVAPVLVLLAGQPGSGMSRATGRLRGEMGSNVAVLRSEDMRAFHPASHGADTDDSEVQRGIAEAAAGWLQGCLRYARENRHSVLLAGTFPTPAVALGVAERFATEGFQSRVVVVAARRAESLLALVSDYFSQIQAGFPARLTGRGTHDRGWEGTLELVDAAGQSPSVGRITILNRAGTVAFDATRVEPKGPITGVGAALARAYAQSLTSLQSAQWLSELRRVSEFTATLRNPPRPVLEMLVELHELAIREIVPELPVPKGSDLVARQERHHATELVALRRALAVTGPPEGPAAPTVTPGGPDRGGPAL